MPVKYDIPVWKGNSVALPMRLTQIVGDLREPVDLTGSLLLFKAVISKTELLEIQSPTGIVLTNPSDGRFQLNLTPEQTLMLPAGMCRYELDRSIGEEVTTLVYGLLKISDWIPHE